MQRTYPLYRLSEQGGADRATRSAPRPLIKNSDYSCISVWSVVLHECAYEKVQGGAAFAPLCLEGWRRPLLPAFV